MMMSLLHPLFTLRSLLRVFLCRLSLSLALLTVPSLRSPYTVQSFSDLQFLPSLVLRLSSLPLRIRTGSLLLLSLVLPSLR